VSAAVYVTAAAAVTLPTLYAPGAVPTHTNAGVVPSSVVKEKCIEVCGLAPYARRTWRGVVEPPLEVFHATGFEVNRSL
jgi:hypothetical protein